MRSFSNSAFTTRKGWAGSRGQTLAVATAALFALSLAAPASAVGGCQLKSQGGKVTHVVTIIFDNTHFNRDPLRDGTTPVPSDLEQMPSLLNFIKSNGVLLSNHHTQLISHTSDDIITILTGVYPERHGIATAANNYLEYTPTGARSQPGFTYWTDLDFNNTYNLLSGAVDTSHPNGVNAPAPWVPFTRAGCDVGAAAAADMEIENTGVDLSTVFGVGSPQTKDPNAFANYEGVAIHCASGSKLCLTSNGGFPDKLPWEPNGGGFPGTPNAAGTSKFYNGYNALFGHKYVTQAFNNLGLKKGGSVLDANGNLKDINGNVIVDDFNNTLTPGFPGFSIPPQYSLGYVADMLEAGVPVVYAYINTPHRPISANPYGYGVAGDRNDYGPGEKDYVIQLQQYDDSFNKFFTRLANDGITPANTVFVIMAEEGDHVVAAQPTNTPCDGVNTACTYGNTSGNEVGEINLNFRGLLQAETSPSITTFASVNSDDAPDIYLINNPGPNDSGLRAFERASGTLFVTNPITSNTDIVAQEMANPVEFNLLHMQTFDPLRTPSFTIFANDDYFVTGSTACETSTTPQTSCVVQAPGFAWNHGDVQNQITNTWLAMVGPGVNVAGVDNTTLSDHTDVRPTLLTLLGLKDDYSHEGRALVEKMSASAQPSGVNKSANFVALAQALKQINAAVGPFGLATLHASTVAMESGDSQDDSNYTNIDKQLASYAFQRDALVAQIEPLVEAAEFDGTPISDSTAQSLIQQAQDLLSSVQAYASSL